MWMYEGNEFQQGDNAITLEERLLCKAYEARGRQDLSDCVKNGRVYQRLRYILHCSDFVSLPDSTVLGTLNGLASAIDPSIRLPSSIVEWEEQAMKRHHSDPDLPEVTELDHRLKAIKRPEWPPRFATSAVAANAVTSSPQKPIVHTITAV